MGFNALELKNVNVYYGSVQVVYNLSMKVEKGELVYLMGRNGAGKTTTLKSIVGLTPPRSGSIKFEGTEISGKQPFILGRLGLGFVPDDRRIFPFLTVLENLEIFSEKRSDGEAWQLERIYELFPALQKLKRNRAGSLSGGEQEMLAIARALMRNPKVLLLDEPFEGLAPVIVKNLEDAFQKIKGEVSILLVEQNVKDAIRLADRCYFMDRGIIRAEHSGKEMLQFLETGVAPWRK